ncbi:type II toxin-antitoxin system HicA family toxin [Faecalibacterium duncaniae]|jgi:mRNA interferase HicA
MPMTPKQMICLLKQHGFVLVNSNGSHHKFYNPTTNRSTTVPYHAKDLKPGTEKAILRQAGIKK